ncbi:MAG: hypothetical protein DME25_16685, partial [Verrucomicrobia bacterium]
MAQMNHTDKTAALPPLDLSWWRRVPDLAIGVGTALCVLGLVVDFVRHHSLRQFGFSWLLAFMFWLSLSLGALFLVMMHHLFDAAWSAPIRRFCEHLACLVFPWLAVFFLPIAALASSIYSWMREDPRADASLAAKWPLFTRPMFYVTAALCFAVWRWLAYRL